MYKPQPWDIDLPPTRSVYIDIEIPPNSSTDLKGNMSMSEPSEKPDPDSSRNAEVSASGKDSSLAEDLLLLLFQPGTGTVAGEGTLYYVLAGAVLADLSLGGHVTTGAGRTGGHTVKAIAGNPPTDHLLRTSWEYVADKARGVQTVLATIGATLREPLLDRLVERGDLHHVARKRWGLFETSVLEVGDNGRRDGLLADVRSALVDGTEATPRIAALAALLYASGTLPQFDRDIPWTSSMVARAEEFMAGNWGADAAANAVVRTLTSTIVNSVVSAAAALR